MSKLEYCLIFWDICLKILDKFIQTSFLSFSLCASSANPFVFNFFTTELNVTQKMEFDILIKILMVLRNPRKMSNHPKMWHSPAAIVLLPYKWINSNKSVTVGKMWIGHDMQLSNVLDYYMITKLISSVWCVCLLYLSKILMDGQPMCQFFIAFWLVVCEDQRTVF